MDDVKQILLEMVLFCNLDEEDAIHIFEYRDTITEMISIRNTIHHNVISVIKYINDVDILLSVITDFLENQIIRFRSLIKEQDELFEKLWNKHGKYLYSVNQKLITLRNEFNGTYVSLLEYVKNKEIVKIIEILHELGNESVER
jgi:hypothetical protein